MARLLNLWMASDREPMVGYVRRLRSRSRRHEEVSQRLAMPRGVRKSGLSRLPLLHPHRFRFHLVVVVGAHHFMVNLVDIV